MILCYIKILLLILYIKILLLELCLIITNRTNAMCVSIDDDVIFCLLLYSSLLFSPLLPRWLFGQVVCQGYAVCGVLFGLCSLTNLTALSSVCCLKVCFPHYGMS